MGRRVTGIVRACRLLLRTCFVKLSDQICRSNIANVIELASVLCPSTTYRGFRSRVSSSLSFNVPRWAFVYSMKKIILAPCTEEMCQSTVSTFNLQGSLPPCARQQIYPLRPYCLNDLLLLNRNREPSHDPATRLNPSNNLSAREIR